MKRAKSLAALAGLLWLGSTHAADPDASAAYERAQSAYETGHYALALEHFRKAAELGDVRSPSVLALMYRFGGRLYGDQVPADPGEAARWAVVAATRLGAIAVAAKD